MNKYREQYRKKKFKKCPFCVWTSKYKKHIVSETEHYYLTINHYPYIKHHMLIAPKQHIESLIKEQFNLEKENLTKLAGKIFLKLGIKNYVVLDRAGNKSGRSLKHIHRHVIPVDGPNDMYYRMADIREDLNLEGEVEKYKKIK